MIPKHPLPWDCWVYDVVNSTTFWVLTFWIGISPSQVFGLDKTSSLLAFSKRINEDRMVACSIWSPQKGINNPQRCTEKINGRTFPAYNIVDSTTSNLDIRLIHSPLIHAEILVNWVLHIHFLRVQMTPKHPLPWGCWVYDVVTSTMFGVPTFWTGIIPSQIIWLDKASCLLASTERNNENRALVLYLEPTKGNKQPTKVQGEDQWKNYPVLWRRRLNHFKLGHEIHPLIPLSYSNSLEMIPLHPFPWSWNDS
jgi:hypothetical protein